MRRLADENAEASRIMLGLLDAVEQERAHSQRHLASELGIALGLVNAYLKRCMNKGLVKVREAPARRYAYYLTPGLRRKIPAYCRIFLALLRLLPAGQGGLLGPVPHGESLGCEECSAGGSVRSGRDRRAVCHGA